MSVPGPHAEEMRVKLVTSVQMHECDHRTIAGIGLAAPTAGPLLMERAGWGIYAALRQQFGGLRRRAILIFCGRGNNGGDGLVVARLLEERRLHPEVFLLADPGSLAPDAQEQWTRYLALGGRHHVVADADRLATRVRHACRAGTLTPPLVLDALLGTGSRGAPRGLCGAAVTLIQQLRATTGAEVLAVDLPTGLDADTGQVPGAAVAADLTVTMAYAKVGFFAYPGRLHTGRVRVVDIGIPRGVEAAVGLHLNLMTVEEARLARPTRRPDAHKGQVGRLLIVGGSVGMTGAPALAARAALRSGAGLVTLAVPASLNPILEAKLTEAMTFPCPESSAGGLSRQTLARIRARAERTDVHVVGPGMGRDPEAQDLVREMMATVAGPLIVDADGLYALGAADWRRELDGPPPILTPHLGEMERLEAVAPEHPGQLEEQPPWSRAMAYARSHRCVLVLKGAPTVVADPAGEVWINPTGNPGLATGGSGDVLTGIIAALVGQHLDPATAARLGVFLHGLAADLAREDTGAAGLQPSDVIEYIPAAWKVVTSPKGRNLRHLGSMLEAAYPVP